MSYTTINSFIEELQRISEDKRKLPLVIYQANGLETEPEIKMMYDGRGYPVLDGKVAKMVIT